MVGKKLTKEFLNDIKTSITEMLSSKEKPTVEEMNTYLLEGKGKYEQRKAERKRIESKSW